MYSFNNESKRRLGVITSNDGNKRSFRIVIPMRFVKKLGWESGQKILVRLTGNHVTLWSKNNVNGPKKDKA